MSQMYHFIGIGGIGMSALARILLQKNILVSGSDLSFHYTIERLVQAGANIYKGHSADLIKPQMAVVYSSDIKPDNPEYLAAIEMQCPLLHRADLLAQLIQGYRSLAVTGTHGKTTTAALLSTVLAETGLDPCFAVGGILPQYQTNSSFGQGEYFAFEADESDRSFLKYFPFGAIVTNIDNDHLNNYEGRKPLLINAFRQFMSQVSSCEHLFWCADDPSLMSLNMPGKSYGFHEQSDWKASHFRQEGFKIFFDIEGEGKVYSDVEVPCIGSYNATNVLAVFGLAVTLGVAEEAIRKALKSFGGVSRRSEYKGEMNGITFLDDYAHHPTEIRATLQAIREAIGEKRLIVAFQPHRYSRTKDCLGFYGNIFDVADELIMTDIFGAGELPIPNLSHIQIMEEVQAKSSIPVQYFTRSALSHFLSRFVCSGDVVITLGAGDITKLGPETIAYLEKQEYQTTYWQNAR